MPTGFRLVYAESVQQHLRAIDKRFHSLIRQTIEDQLQYEPYVETRNRKPLKQPSILGETWELRFGPDNRFRVFYETDAKSREVFVVAIGVKVGNRLLVGGQEFPL